MRIRIFMVLVMSVVLTLLLGLDTYHRRQVREEASLKLQRFADASGHHLRTGLRERSLAVEELAAFFSSLDTLPDYATFRRYAIASLKYVPSMRALQYADANNVIRYIYPLEGNEAAQDLDLMTRPMAAPWVEKTLLEQRTTLADPQVTIQGSWSVIIRTPITRNGHHVGLAQGVVDLEELLLEVAERVPDDYAMRLVDSQNKLFWGRGKIREPSVTVPLNSWRLTLSRDAKVGSGTPDYTSWTLWLLGMALIVALEIILHGMERGVKHLHSTVERKTEALQASDLRFKILIEGASEGIVVADIATSRFVYANAAMCTFLGYTPDELLKRRVSDIHPAEKLPELLTEFEAVSRGEKSITLEVPCLTREGAIVYADISATVIEIDGLKCNMGFFMDVSERLRLRGEKKSLEAHLRQAQKMESLGTFASGVAHEINNPILGISGMAELIEEGAGNDAGLREMTSSIKKEAMRIHQIVKNLLGFARTDTAAAVRPEEVSDIVNSTVSLIRTLMRYDHISLEVNIPPSLPPVLCVRQQIQQVLMNLLTNARDALNEKAPVGETAKCIRLRACTHQIAEKMFMRVTVEDDGTGIPESIRQRIFDPFFTTKPLDKGTGLGLWIVYGIVKEHGGNIEVESLPGEYTRFHVDLPLSD